MYVDAGEYEEILEQEYNTETARQRLKQFWDQTFQSIQVHGGSIVERAERHVTALWGLITSREDDAEQATHAALSVQTFLRDGSRDVLDDAESLPLKIGLNTSMALLAHGHTADSVTVSGSAVTLASRLADQAEGTILASQDTYRHIRGMFDIVPADPLKLRGRKELLPTYRVIAAKVRSMRMETPQIEGLETAMIGRQGELKQLQNAYLNASEDEETQVITIMGGLTNNVEFGIEDQIRV